MKQTILVLSAENSAGRKIGKLLASDGYAVKYCHDARQALGIALHLQPDLVVCERDLPVINGRELARLFKSHEVLCNIPFLMVTRKMPPVEEMERAGMRIMADDFIELPAERAGLLKKIERWLTERNKPQTINQKMAGPLVNASQAKSGRPWNKGKVSPSSLSRLFLHLIHFGESGTLRFKGDRRQLKILIQSGSVVELKSNYIRDNTLGRFLIQVDKITPRENDASIRLSEEKGIPQGQALVMMNILNQNELDYYLAQQKILKVLQVFTAMWRGAAFHFAAERLSSRRYDLDPVPLVDILKRGILEFAEAETLQRAFARNRKESCVMELGQGHTEIMKELRLDPDLYHIADTLNNMSLHRLKETSSDRFETYMRVAFLPIMAKGLVFGDMFDPEEEAADDLLVREFELIGEPDDNVDPQLLDWNLEEYSTNLTEGRTFFNRGDFRGAHHFLEKALDLNPVSSEAVALMAWCIYELSGKQDITIIYEAKEMLKKAISLDDTNDEAYLLLGRIFKAEGKDSLAGTYFRRANEINPANEDARREVKLLQIKKRRSRDLGFRG
ncbi:MAG: response regulator [Candidatus Lernaella stagnicola]|nr:response regulator [Candidatus Lernaella stagnicola]